MLWEIALPSKAELLGWLMREMFRVCAKILCRRNHGRLHGRARPGGNSSEAAEAGCVAESVSGVRNYDAVSRVYVGMSQDRVAGLWDFDDRIYAAKIVRRAEGAEDVPAGIPESGNFL